MLTVREKQIIENEDPRVLRALLTSMAEHIHQQKELIARLEEERAQRDQASFNLEERVKLLRREIFGKSSEKRAEASDRLRDKSQEDALLFSKAAFPSPEIRESDKGKMRGQCLESMVITHQMSDEDLQREKNIRGVLGRWQETGLFDESTKIQLIERRYVRIIHRRCKYKFIPDKGEGLEKEIIITADGAAELLPGMNYTTEFVAGVVSDKYISHMPLERQTREMESLGLATMKTSTLSRLCALAASSLEPMQEKILREDLIPSDLALHLDETPWKIQAKDQKDGFMWVISNRYGSYYFYKPTRSGQVVKEKLEGYNGPALTDGFSGYGILKEMGITQANCWAHARREFLRLEGHDPSVKPILDLIDELFAVEREAKDFADLLKLRESRSGPLLERLRILLGKEWLKSRDGGQKRKAIEYAQNRWSQLTVFLKDARVPLSNNEAERTIRHAVMGRKNYYGSGNHSGAETAATLFTVIESCKKNDIDPRTFLLMSLERVARGEKLETPLAYARRTRQYA